MIIFRGMTEDNKGVQFISLYEENIPVLCKIIDGYKGLCSYATEFDVNPGYRYFFSHFVNIFHRRFEVWSSDETILYLRIDVQDDSAINLQNLDKYNRLKNVKYTNKKDQNTALPLYEIFCNNLYVKSHCKINPNDVVVDIGANVGFFSYFAICNGASKVYCFEPSKESVKTIKDNFYFPNLIVEEAAVSKHNGGVMFYYNELNSIGSGMFSPEIGNGVICKSINLNEYIIENDIEKINYLKIDCEGAEYEIIEDLSEEYLRNNIDNICIEFHFNTDDRLNTMLEKLKRCGFNVESEGGSEIIQGELGVFYAWKS